MFRDAIKLKFIAARIMDITGIQYTNTNHIRITRNIFFYNNLYIKNDENLILFISFSKLHTMGVLNFWNHKQRYIWKIEL